MFGFLLIDVCKKRAPSKVVEAQTGCLRCKRNMFRSSQAKPGTESRGASCPLSESLQLTFSSTVLWPSSPHIVCIRHRRTRGRVIYAESASDLTTHKLKFTHQPGSYGHQKFTESFRYQMFWDWRIWFVHCQRLPLKWMAMATQALRALSRYEN